ncbi:hypothetical protein B0A55_01783 [Friedmanniomyces simplex]|uniref:Uncharacterized protein n=1 Tax=Friedmanniomyces simplex TaxID=329884 RepID=A0A4U0XXT2_9PEZI|nr:hypothetical protein B0A55_01783 [Friedmanniomyces simplex]
MYAASKLHVYTCGHETRLTITQPHSTRPETRTRNSCALRTDLISEPCTACRPRGIPRTFEAAGLLSRAADLIQEFTANVIRRHDAPGQITEADWMHQRVTEEVRAQFAERRVQASRRRRAIEEANRGARHTTAPPIVQQQGSIDLERRMTTGIIAQTTTAYTKLLTSISREKLLPEPPASSSSSSQAAQTRPPPRPQDHPEASASKQANRHAVVINNHLFEANGQDSEIWFAGQPAIGDAARAPLSTQAIEHASTP